MAILEPTHRRTHEVQNQPPPLEGYDVYGADAALVAAFARYSGGAPDAELHELGRRAGGAQAAEWARQANGSPPVLRTHDRFGNRIDEVEYHPAYHELMRVAVAAGIHARPWADPDPDAHLRRAVKFVVWDQAEAGHLCPVSMTYAAVPALRFDAGLAAEWEPLLESPVYDESFRPAPEKRGAIAGMGMTEKQGGSDVRANTTRAEPTGAGGPGAPYELVGHKWFCSAPMSDVFLVLAQAPGGLSCFVVPRWLPDGTRNVFMLQRLKDKLGNRANASSEVELDGTVGWMLGDEGRGVATIIEMVNRTRLDCTLGAAGNIRQAVAQATHHAAHRSAFGRLLADQPLMQNVLADLAIESEAATWLGLRLAHACDAEAADGAEADFGRLATAVGKYWTCKRQPVVVAEALECLGGNGYIEESPMPRLYREAPLNGVWEGSGNVICLDVLRAIRRDPGSLDAFFAEVDLAAGGDARLDAYAARVRRELGDLDSAVERRARRLVEDMVLALQGSLLVREAPATVADAFCASRLGDDHGLAFGTLPASIDPNPLVERATPRG